MSADIVDIRPDRFLRAMRETGNWTLSCAKSGLTSQEANDLCMTNAKYDLATIECQLQFIEEQMIEATEAVITKTREDRQQRIDELRKSAMVDHKVRHG